MGRLPSVSSMLKPAPKRAPKRAPQNIQVENLKMTSLQASIQWRGMVRLHQLNEDSESYLAEVEWPKKSGRIYYGCASSGLLFDKQSGACRQSSNVTLDMGSVESVKFTAAQFGKWHRERVMGGTRDIVISKRGPKPKGYVAPEAEDADY